MVDPIVLCVAAVVAAAVAAAVGHFLHPGRRRARRRAQEREALRFLAAGRLARDGAWTAFWYDHELDTLDAPGGGA